MMMIIECQHYSHQGNPRRLHKDYYTELRLDNCQNWRSIDFDSFTRNTILTCKGELLCRELVSKMFSSRALVDIEVDDLPQYHDLVDPKRLILSLHLPLHDETRIREFIAHKQPAFVYKLVYEADTFGEIKNTVDLLDQQADRNFIFNVTGKWALFQRSLFDRFHSCGLYMAADKPLYEGQPQKFAMIFMLARVLSPDIELILVAGDERVNTSGSLTMGNHILELNGEKKVFIPVPAKNISELIEVYSYLRKSEHIVGFTVTSPFKAVISEHLKLGTGPVNSIQLLSERHDRNFYNENLDMYLYARNTDTLALEVGLSHLDVATTNSVLIYGNGACAKAFIKRLKRLGFTNISLMARNPAKAEALCKDYGVLPASDQVYDLLINASPLGLSEADDLGSIPGFRKLINLPLANPLNRLEDLSREKQIPVFTAETFWFYQFSEQMQIFCYPHPFDLDKVKTALESSNDT